MPDFTVRITVGGVTTIWSDPAAAAPYVSPAGALAPSRLNPVPAYPPKYQRIIVPSTPAFAAKVGGVEGPADGALGGRLFQWSWAEWSGVYPPTLIQNPGVTSIVTVPLTVDHFGHFLLLCWRQGGGAVAIPFDVEA